MKFLKVILILTAFLLGYKVYSQDNFPFKPGEDVSYVVSYNWSFIWIDVGEARFLVKEKKIKNKTYLDLNGWGKTYSNWDHFFKVRDYYKSVVYPESLKPVFFLRDVEEGDIKFKITYKFIRKKNLVYAERKGNTGAHHLDTVKVSDDTYDLLSIIYYARTLDFKNLKPNQKVPISIMLDRKYERLYFRYIGREIFEDKKVGKFKTIKIKVLTVPSFEFKGGETLTIWVTDDKNHIPVWIESPISVGAVKVRLKSYKNLKYPLTSKIK
jgi:hypothetical protein